MAKFTDRLTRLEQNPKPPSIVPIPNGPWRPPPPAMVGSDLEPDIAELFCHYNALYFRDSLGACAVSWAEEPLPYGEVSSCDCYPGGGGCIILLSKSLHYCHTDSDLKNVLLHEMIHAYMSIKGNNSNHGDHGANFQKLMNTINFNSIADPHRPVGGYSITMLHEIRKKYYRYKCESCGDLFKSIKIGGPSHDDCTGRTGANYSCQNSMCHWHRHKKRCSGSYYRVQESPPGCVELKGSKASAEEPLDEGKVEKSVCGSWHAKHTSNKCGISNKHELEDPSAEFLRPTDDAIGSSGLDSSSRDRSNKKIKLSKDTGFDILTGTTVQEAPKRPRTDTPKKNQERSRQKKRKISKWDGSYSVIIEWLNYYSVDESDEDEAPLVNKRTERRKRQKLLKNSQANDANNDVGCASSTSHVINGSKDSCFGSCSQGPVDNTRSENVPASRVEERLLPNHPVSHGVAGDQAGLEAVPSPLDSPIIGEIVDISDG